MWNKPVGDNDKSMNITDCFDNLYMVFIKPNRFATNKVKFSVEFSRFEFRAFLLQNWLLYQVGLVGLLGFMAYQPLWVI